MSEMILRELFLVHKLTCGKRESVSMQHSMKNRRAVGLLNPMRDKNLSREPGGRRDDTRDHGLSRSWKVEVSSKKKKKKEAPQANILAAKNRCFFIAEARGRLRRSS